MRLSEVTAAFTAATSGASVVPTLQGHPKNLAQKAKLRLLREQLAAVQQEHDQLHQRRRQLENDQRQAMVGEVLGHRSADAAKIGAELEAISKDLARTSLSIEAHTEALEMQQVIARGINDDVRVLVEAELHAQIKAVIEQQAPLVRQLLEHQDRLKQLVSGGLVRVDSVLFQAVALLPAWQEHARKYIGTKA